MRILSIMMYVVLYVEFLVAKKNAIDYMYSFVKNEFNGLEVLYDEENDKYSLQDKDTKEIDECDIWYTIEEHELN